MTCRLPAVARGAPQIVDVGGQIEAQPLRDPGFEDMATGPESFVSGIDEQGDRRGDGAESDGDDGAAGPSRPRFGGNRIKPRDLPQNSGAPRPTAAGTAARCAPRRRSPPDLPEKRRLELEATNSRISPSVRPFPIHPQCALSRPRADHLVLLSGSLHWTTLQTPDHWRIHHADQPVTVLEILCCPRTRVPVELSQERRAKRKIEHGAVKYYDGKPVDKPLQEGLVTEDGAVVYRIDDNIPVMLVEQGIPTDPLRNPRAEQQS